VKKTVFDSAELPGDRRQRMERWVESLSSGYVRLGADPAPDMRFRGQLKIVQMENASIGTIDGTVRNISRTAADVVFENTNNVVLLFNGGSHVLAIEQKGQTMDCVPGGAILIEQCEPSQIKATASEACSLIAVQVPRWQLLAPSARALSLIYPFTNMAGPSWNYVLKFIITGAACLPTWLALFSFHTATRCGSTRASA